MSEPVSEREMFVESLPLGASRREWAELEYRVLGRTPACPPVVQLIQLKRDLLSPEAARELRKHAAGCTHCSLWGAEPPDDGDPRLASLRRFEALTDMTPPEGDAEPTPFREGQVGSFEDWPVPGHSGTFASAFRHVNHPRQLLEALHEVLPDLLADVGLSRDSNEAFQSFALDKDEQDWQEAPVWLPRTLERFARKKLGLTGLPCVLDQEGWESVFTRCTLRYLARDPLVAHEADRPVAVEFYKSLLHQEVIDLTSLEPVSGEQHRLAAKTAGISEVVGRQLLLKGRQVKRSIVACCLRPAQKR